MSDPIRFIIPGKPTGQGRSRVASIGGHARAYKAAKDRANEGFIRLLAQQAMAGRPAMTGACAVHIIVASAPPASWSKKKVAGALGNHFYPQAKPDLDNVVKAVLDGCNGIVFADDKQVARLAAERFFCSEPGICVEIRPLVEAQA